MKSQINEAIDAYDNNQPIQCLEIVKALLDNVPAEVLLSAELDVKKVNHSSSKKPSIPSERNAVIHWLQLAKDRLVKETTQSDDIALVPVNTSLRAALGLLD